MNMAYFFLIYTSIMMHLYTTDNQELICLYTATPMKIDARLNEWDDARSIAIQNESQDSDNITLIKTLWDNHNLYIAFHVQDKNLKAEQVILDHAKLYLDDMVEFLIDTRNDKDSCWNEDDIIYHINLLGQKKDDKGSVHCVTNPTWNGNAEYAIKTYGTLNDSTDIDIGYIVEVGISWKEIDLSPVEGLKIGVNFAVGDNGVLFDWVGASPFRSPYAFGDLVLTKK